jgi:co-chaperonin GroES (HSP10)
MGTKEPEMSGEEINRLAEEKAREARSEILEKEKNDREEYEAALNALLKDSPFTPLNDRILVFPERVGSVDKKTESGLIIIDSIKKNAKKATNKGTVLCAGPGLKLPTGEFVSPPCATGDVVMYEQFGYSEVFLKVNGKEWLCHVCRAGDILGKSSSAQANRVAGF